MLIILIAPPCREVAQTVRATRQLLERLYHAKVDYIQATSIEHFRADWRLRAEPNLMIFSDAPDAALSGILEKSQIPIVFLFVPPESVALELIASLHMNALEAVRLTSLSFSSLQEIVTRASNLFVVNPKQDLETVLRNISDIYKLDEVARRTSDVIREVCSIVADDRQGTAHRDELFALSLDPPLAEVLAPFSLMGGKASPGKFVWPLRVLLATNPSGDPVDGALQETIHLTGPARTIFYGPYLHLPRGKWVLQLGLEVFNNLSGNELSFEVILGVRVVNSTQVTLPAYGTYEVWLQFIVEEPREAVQVRMATRQGAIEGDIRLMPPVLVKQDAFTAAV